MLLGAERRAVLGRAWPQLRAALITFALFSQCISALPERALTEEKLARREGDRAVHWLNRLFDRGEPESRTREKLIVWSQRGIAARSWLLTPFAPVLQGASLRQQWNLFVTVGADANRLRVDVHGPHEDWTTIYRANELDSLGLAPLLDYRRVRGIYNPNRYGPRGLYAAWSKWLAERVLREHAEYSALRVVMEHLHIAERGAEPRLLDTRFVMAHSRPEPP
jgi:hypothetical protein